MADITLKLIWYRLSQSYTKMATAASSWYTDLDFDSYVLDLLLLGWCAGAAIVVVVCNNVKNAFGPSTKQPGLERFRETAPQSADGAELASVQSRSLDGETCQWFNTVLSWLYLHYYHSPVYLDEWIKGLNVQLTKLGGPVQNRFEAIQPGSLPPKILNVTTQATPDGGVVVLAKVASQDLLLSLFTSQQTTEGVRLTNCVAHVLKLNGTLRLKGFRDGKDVKVVTNFEGRPEVKVEVKPTNPYQDPSTLVDLAVVEHNVRNAVGLATTTLTITSLLMPGDLSTIPGMAPEEEAPSTRPGEIRVRASDAGWGMNNRDLTLLNQRFTAQNLQNQMAQLASSIQQPSQTAATPVVQQVPPQSRPHPMHSVSVQKPIDNNQSFSVQPSRQEVAGRRQPQPTPAQKAAASAVSEPLFEPISASHNQSAFSSPSGPPLKPPRMVGDKRLYVKVIKGNALTLPGKGAVNAVCYVSTDEPVQSYQSSVVRSSANPFWDEHFLFDVTHDTRELRFEVYDKVQAGEDYVGESTLYMEDLKKTPSSRQILRLQSQPGSFDYSTGTITAEFLFMEPAEADTLLNSMAPSVSQLSPRRRIEVSQVVTPGGTRVTTTTTTTQKPQYGRPEPGYTTTPNYIEKSLPVELDTSYLSSNPGDTSAELVVINGVESVADTAIRELMDRSRRPRTPTKTSTLIITGVKRVRSRSGSRSGTPSTSRRDPHLHPHYGHHQSEV